ncbi:methylthioadenosine phosphorylase (plasmid) [Burkholderia thailandensis 34]|uniref:S-methyl-5'-thioadenosine phosphorylase n=1 Tax=Burkholderia thailandensis TaxID=57975 RepID=UPI0005F0ED41|nr:S-methyl-5'-thioadenosine phosphorylase [Burkholderia thailandensis]AJY27173.1 methylthioadenosine phosphorylase [Burkholderia thailandensis 34]AOJ58561.1 S-methyl-5'-thioadenosine phosphorylase [Burkholderia thailandensis]KXF59739.1 S-methyl-5'-thioadenosine phosphorylase [Burkholderia thailandensis]PNE73213.1 S-methyl-5'-thioadenosine phosphorylase [Burkholderia thailandensis]
MNANDFAVGIIGGSGLYQMDGLADVQEIDVVTPFGAPSDRIVTGWLGDVRVAFVARHGRQHTLLPSEVPYRANIYALKQLGVRYLLSVSAVGSLQEALRPRDIVLPDQFIDRTYRRDATFFGDGVIAHVAFATPICLALSGVLATAVRHAAPDVTAHSGGAYVCIEGPAFSTFAESTLYRQWNASVVGMTNLPEAKLAREAEIAYATLALVTDYDCWHPSHESVTVEMAIANLQHNAANAKRILARAIAMIADGPPPSAAHDALRTALVTPASAINPAARERLAAIIGKYLAD